MPSEGEGEGEASCLMENGAARAETKRETNIKTKARDLKEEESAILECVNWRVTVLGMNFDCTLTSSEEGRWIKME